MLISKGWGGGGWMAKTVEFGFFHAVLGRRASAVHVHGPFFPLRFTDAAGRYCEVKGRSTFAVKTLIRDGVSVWLLFAAAYFCAYSWRMKQYKHTRTL